MIYMTQVTQQTPIRQAPKQRKIQSYSLLPSLFPISLDEVIKDLLNYLNGEGACDADLLNDMIKFRQYVPEMRASQTYYGKRNGYVRETINRKFRRLVSRFFLLKQYVGFKKTLIMNIPGWFATQKAKRALAHILPAIKYLFCVGSLLSVSNVTLRDNTKNNKSLAPLGEPRDMKQLWFQDSIKVKWDKDEETNVINSDEYVDFVKKWSDYQSEWDIEMSGSSPDTGESMQSNHDFSTEQQIKLAKFTDETLTMAYTVSNNYPKAKEFETFYQLCKRITDMKYYQADKEAVPRYDNSLHRPESLPEVKNSYSDQNLSPQALRWLQQSNSKFQDTMINNMKE